MRNSQKPLTRLASLATLSPFHGEREKKGRGEGKGSQMHKKKINLALQGGGAHGAFTWGVLDHLLSDERLDIEGISGTSAGAINAVMLADGFARGGARGSAQAARGILARREPRRQSPGAPARRRRPAVLVHALRGLARAGLVQRGRALHVALRSQSAQHQSAARPDRALRRFRRGARVPGHQPVHFGHQCAHRPPARVSAGQDHRRCRDGVGLPADAVSRGRDRRRALLGRRLHGQSGDSFRSSARRSPRTCWWCRSIRWSAPRRRRRNPRS